MSTTTNLFVDGGIYRFNGLLSDLKHFVDETLGLKGNWSSPWGDVKLFNAADSGFAIKWYGHSKTLVIQTDNEHKFASLANPVGSDVVAGASNGVSESRKICTCPYTCVNSNIFAELEGVKLDMTILESRLFASISQQESKSDEINSLRVKQKDMEAIINKKDEVICKLNEEIQ